MATLAVMGAMMAGCASEDNIIADPQQPAGPTGPLTLTTTVTLGDGANTRALTSEGVKTFKEGDKIAVKYIRNDYGISKTDVSNALKTTDISSDGKTATFTVTLTYTPKEGCNVTYVYPAVLGEDGTRDEMIQNDQDGTLTTLASKFDYCEGSGTMGGTAPNFVLPTGVTLENQLTLAKFTVSAGTSDITSSVTQLMIDDGTHCYTVNRTAAAGPIWVAMYPIASTQKIKVTAVNGTDLYQSGDITGKTLAKNNYYDISVTTPQIDMSYVSVDLKQPLTFEAKGGAATVKFKLSSCVKKPVEYSTDGGSNWVTYTTETEISLASEGDKVMFRGNNAAYSEGGYNSTFSVTDGGCYVYGNVMSLVNATAFPLVKTLTANDAFRNLFDGCNDIYSHDSEKIVLPATTLTKECYAHMFSGCGNLTTAPALPATTLTWGCYYYMFNRCSSLTTAPALPATTLVDNCYFCMFSYCRNLNYVKCLATDISADNCTKNWLNKVSVGGTFIISDDLDSSNPVPWTSGPNGIPSGWTVKKPLNNSIGIVTGLFDLSAQAISPAVHHLWSAGLKNLCDLCNLCAITPCHLTP